MPTAPPLYENQLGNPNRGFFQPLTGFIPIINETSPPLAAACRSPAMAAAAPADTSAFRPRICQRRCVRSTVPVGEGTAVGAQGTTESHSAAAQEIPHPEGFPVELLCAGRDGAGRRVGWGNGCRFGGLNPLKSIGRGWWCSGRGGTRPRECSRAGGVAGLRLRPAPPTAGPVVSSRGSPRGHRAPTPGKTQGSVGFWWSHSSDFNVGGRRSQRGETRADPQRPAVGPALSPGAASIPARFFRTLLPP